MGQTELPAPVVELREVRHKDSLLAQFDLQALIHRRYAPVVSYQFSVPVVSN
jgi:hypothetical protein